MRRKLNWKFIRNLNNKSVCQLIYIFCIVLIVHCDKKELIYSTRSLTGRRIIIHYNVFSQILFQMNYWQSFHSTNAFEIKICDKIDGFVANREIVQIPTENNTNKLNNKSDIGRWSTSSNLPWNLLDERVSLGLLQINSNGIHERERRNSIRISGKFLIHIWRRFFVIHCQDYHKKEEATKLQSCLRYRSIVIIILIELSVMHQHL